VPKSAMRRRLAVTVIAALGLAALPALAAYPEKPLRMLVPFGAGGITDFVARAVAEQLGKELGQTVIVDNRPGAGGNIAAEALKNAPADGYTLMLTTMGLVSVNPHTYSTLRFDPLKDFTYITTIADTPHAVVVSPAVPAATLPELIALAKQKPEGLSYGTAGSGSSPHQGLETLQASTGTRYLHVPFKSGAESVTNVMGGQVSMTFEALPVVLPHGQTGKLKVLAIAAPKRHASAPDLKTTAELGFPGIRSSSVSGLVGPAGLAADVVEKLNAAARKALDNPQLKQKLFAQGSDATGSTPAQFLDQAKAEHAKWGKIMANVPRI
jgi:tripartite-type tricarboxylate transporter receptor subunit TctC